jgi:hypothetical protein
MLSLQAQEKKGQTICTNPSSVILSAQAFGAEGSSQYDNRVLHSTNVRPSQAQTGPSVTLKN